MAGSKKQKSKKSSFIQTVGPPDEEDDGLMTDLLAQLDSREPNAQSGSTAADDELHPEQAAQTESSGKQSAKSRFKARQVCYVS